MSYRYLFLIFLYVISLSYPLLSQDLNDVAIFGFVTDRATGQPVSGVLVVAINKVNPTERSAAVSDASGKYVINLVTDVWLTPSDGPSKFQLYQSYPNPFNPSTVIAFQIPKVTEVHLVVYNILGQKIKTLIDEALAPGVYTAVWDATDEAGTGVAAGVYFYQLSTESFLETRKMVLLDGHAGGRPSLSPSLFKRKQTHVQFPKANELMVTIRASGPRTETFEQEDIVISTKNFRFDIGVTVTVESVLNLDSIVVSEPGTDGKIYVSGLSKAVIDTVIGTEKVSVLNQRTQESVAMRVDFDGSFPLMTIDGDAGDRLSLSLLKEGQQVGESDEVKVETEKEPVVTDSKPTNGDKDIIVDARIFIDFSEPIDSSTVTVGSFILASSTGNVPGTLGFLNDNTVATFTPDQPLAPLTTYTITVTTEVTDLQGIHLGSTFTSTFTTGSGTAEGRIAFTSNNSIYVIDNDGSNLTRLTKREDVGDGCPSWSPDGTKIAFSRYQDGSSDVYIMNSDGTFLENLTNSPTSDDLYPALSPDGGKIAFASNRDGNLEICTMNINGTGHVNLTKSPQHEGQELDWSPDASKIVYTTYRDGIWVMDNDGANRTQLTQGRGYFYPSWSPDGKQIAFVGLNGSDDRIFIMNSDGTNLSELTPGTFYGGLSWAPDGSRLAYIRHNEDNYVAVAIIHIDSKEVQLLTPYEGWNVSPAWSPWPIRN